MNLVIRVDASAEIGTGHVMRMLALAQAWMERAGRREDGGPPEADLPPAENLSSQNGTKECEGSKENRVLFVCALLPEALEQRLKDEGFEVKRIRATPGSKNDLEQTLKQAGEYSPITQTSIPNFQSTNHVITPSTTSRWLVVDGYPFDITYQRAVRAAGFKLMVVDDYNHLPEYECDILLNQNIGAGEYDYQINYDARRLLGPRYALLRREFREAVVRSRDGKRCCREVPEVAKHILVTMGGADLHNVTLKVIEALNQSGIEGLEVKIVVGAANRHLDTLKQAIQSTHSQISYQLIIQATNMPSLMEWADLAITAAGSTCWEVMAMGVPMMTMVLAENQERIGNLINQESAAVNLGWHHAWTTRGVIAELKRLLADQARRARMVKIGYGLLDADGAILVAMTMKSSVLSLRLATLDDARLVWEWANDPETRTASFSSEFIPWEAHLAWMGNRLANPRTRIYLAVTGDEPVGVVRFEPAGNGTSFISVALAPPARGRGLGSRLVEEGTRIFARDTGCHSVHAYVKPENTRSSRMFLRAGYKAEPDSKVKGQPAFHFHWTGSP